MWAKATLVLLVTTCAWSQETLFTLKDAAVQRVPSAAVDRPDVSKVEVIKNGLRFSVTGPGRSRQLWVIPMRSGLVAKHELLISLSSQNVISLGKRPNVYVLMKGRSPGVPSKQIPVYASVGKAGKEFGTTKIDATAGTHSVESLCIELCSAQRGRAELTISSLELSYESNILPRDMCLRALGNAKPSKIAVVPGRRSPLLHLEGKRVSLDGYICSHNPQPSFFSAMARAGFRLNRLSLSPSSFWTRKGYFDYLGLERVLSRACAVPDTLLILDLDLSVAPRWWRSPELADRLSDFDPAWQQYRRNAIIQVLAAARTHPKQKQIVGISLITGPQRGHSVLPDRAAHPAYGKAFNDWIKTIYPTEDLFKRAWQVEFEREGAAAVPEDQWPQGVIGPLAKPGVSQQSLDSRQFAQLSWLQDQLNLLAFIKETGRSSFLCGLQGTLPSLGSSVWRNRHQPVAGMFTTLLAAKDLDFVDLRRGVSDPVSSGAELLLAAQFRAGGKLMFIRDVAAQAQHDPEKLIFSMLVSGWHGAGLLIEPRRPVLFARMQRDVIRTRKLVTRIEKFDRRAAQFAVVVDPDFFQYVGPAGRGPGQTVDRRAWQLHHLFQLARASWDRAGLPYDVVPIDELEGTDYRMLLFWHILKTSPTREKRIAKLKDDDRTLIWVWADGLIGEKRLNPSQMKRLTGMKIGFRIGPSTYVQRPTKYLLKYLKTKEVPQALRVVPADAVIQPSFDVLDRKAKILLMHQRKDVGSLAVREFGDWTSIYAAVPLINPDILRAAALKSDAHVYLYGNDLALVSEHVFMCYAESNGKRMLHLQRKTELYDVLRDKEMEAAKRHEFTVEKGKTYLFFAGDKKTWLLVNEKK